MATERKSVDGGESGLFQAILIVRSIAEGEGIFLYTFLAVFRGKSNLQLLFLCLVQQFGLFGSLFLCVYFVIAVLFCTLFYDFFCCFFFPLLQTRKVLSFKTFRLKLCLATVFPGTTVCKCNARCLPLRCLETDSGKNSRLVRTQHPSSVLRT